jgi:hypothetical protein
MATNHIHSKESNGHALSIECRSMNDLKPNPRNPRKPPKRKIRKVADWIEESGWKMPIVADANGMIFAGHAFVEAVKLVGSEVGNGHKRRPVKGK